MPVDIRHHQYVTMIFLGLFIAAAVSSYVWANVGLHILGMITMWFMTATILIGVIVVAYVKITKDQIFDPLSSELDDDPQDVENDDFGLS